MSELGATTETPLDDEDRDRYRLLSIDAVATPAGCAGRDWFVYRIVQGENAITGYRQGSRVAVGAEVDAIIAALNGRREWKKPKLRERAPGRNRAGQTVE